MRLYLITEHDEQFYVVAHTLVDAVTIWQRARHEEDPSCNDLTDEPDTCSLISSGPVLFAARQVAKEHDGPVAHPLRVEGAQFAAIVHARSHDDPHICIRLQGEDNHQWQDMGRSFSSSWLSDLVTLLLGVERQMKQRALPDPHGGYRFQVDEAGIMTHGA